MQKARTPKSDNSSHGREAGYDAGALDYADPGAMSAALREFDSLYLLGPNAVEQTQLEVDALESALTAGVRSIV